MENNLGPRLGFASNDQKIPDGAIALSPNYLYKLQYRLIDKWESPKEMFALKHGSEILGLIAAVNGAHFTSHFRFNLRLRNYARFATYIPTMFIPALSISLLHQSFITYPMSVGYLPCTTCAEVKSLVLQSVIGFANPFILSVLASFALAKLSASYPLPPFSDYKGLLKVVGNLTRPARYQILVLFSFNLFAAYLINYRQQILIEKVNQKLLKEDIFIEANENL